MLVIQRHRRIVEILEQEWAITVHDLAHKLEVAESTVRRDLEALEKQGRLRRTYGGATLEDVSRRLGRNEGVCGTEKQALGQAAAALVGDDETLFLDGESPVEYMIPYLIERRGLTAVTSGLGVAMRLAAFPEIMTIIIGGELHGPSQSVGGMLSQRTMELYDLYFTRAFIGARGICVQHGVTEAANARGLLKRLAIQRARETVVVAEGCRVGCTATVPVVPIAAVHRLVTDRLAPEAELAALTARGIAVIVV